MASNGKVLQLRRPRSTGEVFLRPDCSRFAFRDLPIDIRVMIYEILLQPRSLKITSTSSHKPGNKAPEKGYDALHRFGPVYFANLSYQVDKKHLYPAILRTLELSPRMMPLVSPRLQQAAGRSFIAPEMLSHVFRVETLHIRFGIWGGSFTHTRSHWECLLAHLNRGLVARRIVFQISTCWVDQSAAKRLRKGDEKIVDKTTADWVEIFRMVKRALREAQALEQVEVQYSGCAQDRATLKMERGGEWMLEGDTTWTQVFEMDRKCYDAFISAAKDILGSCVQSPTLAL